MHESDARGAQAGATVREVPGSLRAELSVAVLERSPEIPARDRRVRTPLRADLLHVLRRRSFALAVSAADGVLNAEVELRQHVAAAEAEHQEHLGRPTSNAFDLHEM